jgi:hypothetical protein
MFSWVEAKQNGARHPARNKEIREARGRQTDTWPSKGTRQWSRLPREVRRSPALGRARAQHQWRPSGRHPRRRMEVRSRTVDGTIYRGNRIIAYHCEGGFRGRASCWRLRRPWFLETDKAKNVARAWSGAGLDPNPSAICGYREISDQECNRPPRRSRVNSQDTIYPRCCRR